MEITGKIKWIDEVKTYGSNGFRKREIVITTQEQYPQNIIIEFVQFLQRHNLQRLIEIIIHCTRNVGKLFL